MSPHQREPAGAEIAGGVDDVLRDGLERGCENAQHVGHAQQRVADNQSDKGLREAEGIKCSTQEHRDHHGRQHDRQQNQDSQRFLAAEGEAADRIGRRQREDEGHDRDDRRQDEAGGDRLNDLGIREDIFPLRRGKTRRQDSRRRPRIVRVYQRPHDRHEEWHRRPHGQQQDDEQRDEMSKARPPSSARSGMASVAAHRPISLMARAARA